MEITDLLVKSSQLMLVGMGVVFAFLSLLILATKTLSSLVIKFQGVPEPIANKPRAASPQANGEIAPQTVAAISAAIHQYRQSTK